MNSHQASQGSRGQRTQMLLPESAMWAHCIYLTCDSCSRNNEIFLTHKKVAALQLPAGSSSCRKAQLIFPWRTTSSRGSSTRPSGLLWILCKAQASQVTCNFGVGLCDTAHQASSGLYGHSSLQELIKHLVKKSPLKPNCFKIFNFSSWADLEVFFFPSPLHFPKMRQLK